MDARITARRIHVPTPGRLPQALLALVGGLGVFAILAMSLVMVYDIAHAGRVYGGVSVAGINLSGLSSEEAAEKIRQNMLYPQNGRVVFQLEDRLWLANPVDLGLFIDAETSAQAALVYGRKGNPISRMWAQFKAWYWGEDLPPLLVYDQRIAHNYILEIARQIDLPTVEASLSINGTDVVVQPGQVGRSVDVAATMAPLEALLRSLKDGLAPVVMQEKPPVILDASAQAEIARKILSSTLTLSLPERVEGDPGPWNFEREQLARMLTFERVQTETGMQYQVGLRASDVYQFLESIAPGLSRSPQNARFIFNDDTRQLELIESAVIGRSLNLEASLKTIQEKTAQGEHSIALVVDTTAPAIVNEVTAEQLGIREAVSIQTSYFYGSSASRIQNIKTASARFHGLLVPPGATFSMAEALGDISLDNGYAEALIIYGNRTIQGVGGGVCQVSTTLFRTVFFGGYPVDERHAHAYRVSYYEMTRSGNVNTDLAGLDAAVFVPVVDFKFTNDTDNWLLMETYVNEGARTLTWKFYSTSEGRSVEWDSTGLQNVEPAPEPVYQENPELDPGEIRQVDWQADGADVTIYRTVYRNGEVYIKDTFSTYYMPWRAVYEYGPGTKIPKKYRGD